MFSLFVERGIFLLNASLAMAIFLLVYIFNISYKWQMSCLQELCRNATSLGTAYTMFPFVPQVEVSWLTSYDLVATDGRMVLQGNRFAYQYRD